MHETLRLQKGKQSVWQSEIKFSKQCLRPFPEVVNSCILLSPAQVQMSKGVCFSEVPRCKSWRNNFLELLYRKPNQECHQTSNSWSSPGSFVNTYVKLKWKITLGLGISTSFLNSELLQKWYGTFWKPRKSTELKQVIQVDYEEKNINLERQV